MFQSETGKFWLSVGLGILAVIILYSYTNEKQRDLTSQYGDKSQVVVAKVDINEMDTIDASMLDTIDRPKAFVEPDRIVNPAEAIGQVALVPVKKGQSIAQSMIMKPGPTTGLSMHVAPGRRAVTIPIDEMRGVAKLIKPGDRIDLVAAIETGRGATQKKEVKTILQDITVLATGLKIVNEIPRLFEAVGNEDFIKNIRSDTSFGSVTVEVSAQEAQNLIYILSTSPGSLFMTLRHPSDRGKETLTQSTAESVLNKVDPSMFEQQLRTPAQAPVVAPPPPVKSPGPAPRRGGFRSL
jgi:pilus assembly protein CpaB